jgi:integrase/recombinase XerD
MTDVVVEYLGALQAERGAARNTLDAYRRDLTDFTRFLSDHRRALGRVGPDDIVEYLERLRTQGLRPASVARRVSALRGLYKHLVREGALRRDPTEHLEAPRRPRALPRTLSREAAAALVEAPDVSEPRGIRDRTALELL